MIFCMHAYHFCSVWWDIYLELYCYAWLCCIWQFQHTKNAPKSGWYSLLLVLGKSQTASLVNSSPPYTTLVSYRFLGKGGWTKLFCWWMFLGLYYHKNGRGGALKLFIKIGVLRRARGLFMLFFQTEDRTPFRTIVLLLYTIERSTEVIFLLIFFRLLQLTGHRRLFEWTFKFRWTYAATTNDGSSFKFDGN